MDTVDCSGDFAELDNDVPRGERWPPLGANDEDEDSDNSRSKSDSPYECERLRRLEEEQEHLNNSLLALTTHFAQVQFRLKQIVDAPAEDRETLLKDLEEYASRGIPDIRDYSKATPYDGDIRAQIDDKMAEQRQRQQELITQLKAQLEDLETFAYVTGEAGPPQSFVMERQKVVLDQLQGKLNLDVSNFEKGTVDDLKSQVDEAVSQLVNPLKMKEQLVHQLKTQIIDLERFISFLQVDEVTSSSKGGKCSCNCHSPSHQPHHSSSQFRKPNIDNTGIRKGSTANKRRSSWTQRDSQEAEELRNRTIDIMRKMVTLLQMFAVSQFGCGSGFHRNSLKRTTKGNHWGDIRARLEVAVGRLLELISRHDRPVDSDYTSDSDEVAGSCSEEITTAVRKEFSPSLQALLEHGLLPVGTSRSVVPFVGCFPLRSSDAYTGKKLHAWELILRYYHLKQGEEFNATPARKLSQSFNLDIVGGTAITAKQLLLSAIGNVIASHSKYKRSYDSHFKAFICAALNSKKLVPWLKLILACQPLLEECYQPWSYAARTGFEDSFRSLEKLSQYEFDLPVDLAVRQFQNIKDAFQ